MATTIYPTDVERVVHAERRRHADLALSAHLHGGAAAASLHGRALEGGRRGEQRQHRARASERTDTRVFAIHKNVRTQNFEAVFARLVLRECR